MFGVVKLIPCVFVVTHSNFCLHLPCKLLQPKIVFFLYIEVLATLDRQCQKVKKEEFNWTAIDGQATY